MQMISFPKGQPDYYNLL